MPIGACCIPPVCFGLAVGHPVHINISFFCAFAYKKKEHVVGSNLEVGNQCGKCCELSGKNFNMNLDGNILCMWKKETRLWVILELSNVVWEFHM